MGMTVEAATGGDTYDLFPEMAAKYHQDDLKVIESGKPLLKRVEKFTPKGQPELWVETDKIPYFDSQSGDRHLLAIARDITVEKENEQKIRDLNRELSSKNERLETSNDSLRQFAHVASHDLQEPLRKLMQFSEYLTEDCGDELSEDGKFFVEVISGSAARMRTLVTDILSLSGATGKDMKREPLDLPAIITDLQNQMEVRITESDATFTVENLPEIEGDKTLVE
jgi:light-regulated signal transduction histidine kinase (bacteriophytochrome)